MQAVRHKNSKLEMSKLVRETNPGPTIFGTGKVEENTSRSNDSLIIWKRNCSCELKLLLIECLLSLTTHLCYFPFSLCMS